jgi:(p)ppGpp synthase/HD superfamily hydrolase
MNKVKDAAKFAIKAHGNQRYGGKPYSYHLEKVYKNAVKHGGSETQQIAAWLHDTIEDTSVTSSDISKEFGSSVARLVDLVSNLSSKETTFKRIRTSKDAVFVKLCDRLANVTEGAKNDKYRKEHPLFKSILYKQGEFESLWRAIDQKLGMT